MQQQDQRTAAAHRHGWLNIAGIDAAISEIIAGARAVGCLLVGACNIHAPTWRSELTQAVTGNALATGGAAFSASMPCILAMV